MEIIHENSEQKENLLSTMELGRDHEITPSEIWIEDHELQDILERENLDLEKFLDQGTNKGIDSLPEEEIDKVQQLFLWRSQTKATGVKRSHDSQENRGIKSMEEASRHSTKNPGKKIGRKRQNELLTEFGKLMINSCKMRDLTSYSFTNPSL